MGRAMSNLERLSLMSQSVNEGRSKRMADFDPSGAMPQAEDNPRRLDDLIAKLEAATGPSRELDSAIAAALGVDGWTAEEWDAVIADPEIENPEIGSAPRFTRSIDAALTLVPEGSRWSIIKQMDDRFLSVVPDRLGWQAMGVAWSAPRAICAASLRVRRSAEANNAR